MARGGSADFSFTVSEINELVEDGNTFEQIVEELEQKINDSAWELEPEMNGDNYEYSGQNSGDYSDLDTDYSGAALRVKLTTWCQVNLSRGQLVDLGLATADGPNTDEDGGDR